MRVLLASVLLIGCSSSDKVHHLPDGPPPPDGAPDAAPAPVTLTITKDGAPVAGVKVYFQATATAPAIQVPTGTDGTASAMLAAGGYVTAVDPFPMIDIPTEVRTFAGVKPGDQLHLAQVSQDAGTTVTVLVPPDVSATSYDIQTTCGQASVPSAGGGSAASTQATLFDCHGTADIVVIVRDANGIPLRSLYHANVAITAGGTVDLTADAYQALDQTVFSFTHVPTTLLQVSSRQVAAHGQVVETLVATDVAQDGSATVTMNQPAVAGGIDVIDSTFRAAFGDHHVVEWGAAGPTHALDMAGLLLPDFTERPSYDTAQQAMVWTPGGGAATPDFGIAEVLVSRSGTTIRQWDWKIASESAAGAIVFPTLPTDAGDVMPAATDALTVQRVTLAQVPGGYDAVRARILDAADFVAGATGRAVVVDAHLGK